MKKRVLSATNYMQLIWCLLCPRIEAASRNISRLFGSMFFEIIDKIRCRIRERMLRDKLT